MTDIKLVAIGDSFTEGVGDERADGSVRGWADLTAEGIAQATGAPIQYANLAIRGRLIAPILEEQLEPAIALRPTHVTFNGGGNDMLRPGTDMASILSQTERALTRILESGAQPILLFGADPTGGLPGGARFRVKAEALGEGAQKITDRLGIPIVDNWNDPELPNAQYWSTDRLHMAPAGHHRVAANVLRALGYELPADWTLLADPVPKPGAREQLRYTREHMLPWIGRRLTGRSSGDGRTAKHPDWVWVPPIDAS